MRYFAFAALAAATLLSGAMPAAAEINYPWCVIYGGRSNGTMSCGFVSYAQCMQTRVATDMCVQNPRYEPRPAPRKRG